MIRTFLKPTVTDSILFE